MDISDNSTIGDSSTTIYVNGSYAGDIESCTQSNPYKQVSSAVGAATDGAWEPVSPLTIALATDSALYLPASSALSQKQHSSNIAGALVFLTT